jgi:hypothetical protein
MKYCDFNYAKIDKNSSKIFENFFPASLNYGDHSIFTQKNREATIFFGFDIFSEF